MGGVTISVEKPPLDFIFSVTTTSTPQSFYLPTVISGTYDYVVDWGDDSSDHIITYNDANRIHSYATPGNYDITISGTLNGWSFSSVTNSRLLVKDIKQWGIFNHGDVAGAFGGCKGLTAITATDTINLTSNGNTLLSNFFYDCENMTTISRINEWDVSNINIFEFSLVFRESSFKNFTSL